MTMRQILLALALFTACAGVEPPPNACEMTAACAIDACTGLTVEVYGGTSLTDEGRACVAMCVDGAREVHCDGGCPPELANGGVALDAGEFCAVFPDSDLCAIYRASCG